MRNTSRIGEVSTAQVMAALIRSGKRIWTPFGDHGRSDLLIEEEDGRFLRVQCKTGRLVKGALVFPTSSMHAPSRTGLEKTVRRSYRGQVELFGVFCPKNKKVYLVPAADVRDNWACLRVDPPRNNQQKHIHWASEYEIGGGGSIRTRFRVVRSRIIC